MRKQASACLNAMNHPELRPTATLVKCEKLHRSHYKSTETKKKNVQGVWKGQPFTRPFIKIFCLLTSTTSCMRMSEWKMNRRIWPWMNATWSFITCRNSSGGSSAYNCGSRIDPRPCGMLRQCQHCCASMLKPVHFYISPLLMLWYAVLLKLPDNLPRNLFFSFICKFTLARQSKKWTKIYIPALLTRTVVYPEKPMHLSSSE